MITQTGPLSMVCEATPTIWGLSPAQLHDRFWAARGVQVVRQGEPSEIVDGAELFLLTEPQILSVFKLTRLVEFLSWIKPDVLYARLHDDRERGYRERVITDTDGRFVRFERTYDTSDSREARVALTSERRLAHIWQKSPGAREGWKTLRQEVPREHRSVLRIKAGVYDRRADVEVMQCVREIVRLWKRPDSTVYRVQKVRETAWSDETAEVGDATKLVGPVWIGAGRRIDAQTSIIGPRILWDDPVAKPPVDTLQWHEIEPTFSFERPVRPVRRTSLSRASKRLFDIGFAISAILLTLPVYPLVMLAIWLEDGWPFFFSHQRETLGGREFGCIKFRSMRKDADQIKARLAGENQADGPQFFIENDPRLTRVGRFIRKVEIDELPQFWNVLKGDMSIVGPRPSPFKENQYCPPWREARLSVRPGITGLWQVRRTRRRGLDFQEWIKYDIEYVEKASWGLDLKIILQTIAMVIKGVLRS
jgi:lipopolysaccharide/colanic/teichoic acid biosynthesis glycosyltransferase